MAPFLIAMPVFQLVLFGYAVSTDVRHVQTVVCDLDNSPTSRLLVHDLVHGGYFDLVSSVQSPSDAVRFLDEGRASLALVIPRDLHRDIARGDTVTVQALFDGSDGGTATVGLAYVNRAVARRGLIVLNERMQRAGSNALVGARLSADTRVLYNPGLETRNFMVPGVVCVVVGLAMTVASALAIVREREIGTMEQLIVTPVRPWELMVGKLVPYLLIGYVDLVAILMIGDRLLGVAVRGSLSLLLLLAGVFLVAQLAIGLAISTVSRTQQQAMLSSVFFLMPNMLLSGFIFPIANMPPVLQAATYALPMRYFLVIVRGIYLKGNGIGQLYGEIWCLVALAVAILAAAASRFRKTYD